jgi:DNA invertase Pin-like site-specific DNA recombinase
MPTCVIYYRVSLPSQADKWSLPAQKSELTSLAQKNNWKILKEYTEVASGKNIEDRPAIQELIADIPELIPDYVCVIKQDRLSRGNDFWQLKTILSRANIRIATPKDITDFSDEKDDFISDIFASYAKLERKMIIARVKMGMNERARQGFHNGQAPYGYSLINQELIINPPEAAIVRLIFDLYLNGYSQKKIISYLEEKNIKPRLTNEFNLTVIGKILKNPIYIGKVKFGSKLYKGKHEPIISEKEFEAVNLLRDKSKFGRRNEPYLLKGIVYCGICGGKMMVKRYTHSNRPLYRGYICINAYYAKAHKNFVYKAEIVDNTIWDRVIKRIERIRLILANQKSPLVSIDNVRSIKKIDRKLKALESDYYIHDRISLESYEDIREKLLTSKKLLEQNHSEKRDYSFIANADLSLLRDANFNEKRLLACQLIEKAYLYNSKKRRKSRLFPKNYKIIFYP